MSDKKPIILDAKTRAGQATASDPVNTVWVSANAGSGKTHVLSQRVIRLLLDGVEPSRILCLTYTKTAAAQMENRVFERLAAWTALDDAKLSDAIFEIESKRANAARLKAARNLFARALETPGGLQIQTIHAFCTSVLKRFPLEANIAGHFELLDDATDAFIREEAKRQITIQAYRGGDEELSSAFETVLGAGGEEGLKNLFEAALGGPNRSALAGFLADLKSGAIDASALDDLVGLAPDDTADKIIADSWPLLALSVDMMRSLANIAPTSKLKTISEFGYALGAIVNVKSATERLEHLAKVFLKADGEPRKSSSFAKEPLLSVAPDLADRFELACAQILETKDKLARRTMLDITRAAHVLIRKLSQRHIKMKRESGKLDYEDLIEATRNLLSRDAAAAWVQYKLDQGIDHVLVDEAQDTSPRQWDLVNALTGDFFSGETAAKKRRTLFVVGDEKQSIYSFQGARPEVFADNGREKARRVKDARMNFESVKFPLSFRSTPEVLKAFDMVFGKAHEGLVSNGDYIDHTTIRADQHGRVEAWDYVRPDPKDETQRDIDEDWTKAVDHLAAPAVILAKNIADEIKRLVGKEQNPATGKLVRAGDILVLVRKRDQFMHALSRELKDRNVPVAGADRLTLTSHIAILDLMALARITLQPDDDLSLAALLRSPVFGLRDYELTNLAAGRDDKTSLLNCLADAGKTDERLALIAASLKRWRGEADLVPVYEFFAKILGRDGVRAKLVGRLGEEASDVIDEFLSYALASEQSGIHGLQSFIEILSEAAPEIKREASAGRDEVRIMTVHGAKGLEAPYVFLVDPGSNPGASHHSAPLITVKLKQGNRVVDGFVWVPKAEFGNSAIQPVRDAMTAQQLAEYKRLLYVGMTRAEDVLIVCGFGGNQVSKIPTWLDMVKSGLEAAPETITSIHEITGRAALRFSMGTTTFEPSKLDNEPAVLHEKLPDYLRVPLKPLKLLSRPLTPSGNGLSIDAQAESAKRSPVLDVEESDPSGALRRGAAVHRLLEVLPNFESENRERSAKRYLDRALAEVDEKVRTRLCTSVMTILNDPRFAGLFADGSRGEVSIGGTIILGGSPHSVSGKIDRLSVTKTEVLIMDYKTNRPPPTELGEVPQSHIAQLALYRALLTPLYPEHAVKAALLYTEGPHFIALDELSLDAALEALTAS